MEGVEHPEKSLPRQWSREVLEDLRFKNFVDVELDPFPYLRHVPLQEKQSLFIYKVRQCTNIVRGPAKDVKHRILVELRDFVKATPAILIPTVVCPEVIRMLLAHLTWIDSPGEPPLLDSDNYDEREIIHTYFPELCILYELVLYCLQYIFTDPSGLENVINRNVVVKAFNQLRSDCSAERVYLKMILVRIYRTFVKLRKFIRKQISNILLSFIYEREDFNGIREILILYEGIESELALPLENEHKLFLEKVLIPLHGTKSFPIFQEELYSCLGGYVHLDTSLGKIIMDGMIAHWPKNDTRKEIMFLKQMREFAITMGTMNFPTILEPYYRQLSKVALTCHFKVAEELIKLLNDGFIFRMLQRYCDLLLPIIVPALKIISQDHWHKKIAYKARKTLARLQKANSVMF